ncbi:sensor histidine kinase [Flagellimonas lutaonensis]|uniref:histidine kinase n=1 Tax=Flagellimonas lutaonensis TaxID=516051 RepID=A0A0D5YWB0_9FLAO|nr:histidine kinase dimerization/phosphoacceptor domain -containing protein [Allomuricauda lutaonensis]AKA36184.1 Signal transduction histidine kinase [Allomuricauda lutaonensis]
MRITTIFIFLVLVCNGLIAQNGEVVADRLQEFQRIQSPEEKLEYFFASPFRYTESSAYDWLDTINVYLNSAEKINDTTAVLSYKLMQSQLYNDLGDYDKSVAIAKDLHDNFQDLGPRTKEMLLNILDDSYGKLKLYDQQLEIRKQKREEGFTENITFYDVYANIGLYREAMKRFIKEVKPTIADNEAFKLAKFYNQVGDFLRKDNSARTAIKEYKKAEGFLQVYINNTAVQKTEQELLESSLLKAKLEGNIGKCHVMLKEYDEGIPLLERSIEELTDFGDTNQKQQLVENSLYLAEAYLNRKEYEKAKKFLEVEAHDLSIDYRLKKNRLLASYYDRTQNYEDAIVYYKRNQRLRDSLELNESSILKKQLVALVANEEIENSQQLIEEQKSANERIRSEIQAKDERINLVFISLVFTLLGFAGLVYAYLKSIKNQRLIAQQKHIIENSLIEKDSLLKEIHHRVKNNLQMVSSLLSLQTKNTRSKAAIEALEEGKSRVKAMALIHQKLYQNDDLSVIEMQGYIESLINSVQSVYKKGGHNISITIDAEGTELDIDRAIPFGLILNELVSNSFKYAFPESDENGKIYIHLRKNGDQGYFEYTDNGVGLPDDTDERANSSMGIRLINRLVNQLQSKLNIDKTNEGVRFWFNFS